MCIQMIWLFSSIFTLLSIISYGLIYYDKDLYYEQFNLEDTYKNFILILLIHVAGVIPIINITIIIIGLIGFLIFWLGSIIFYLLYKNKYK